ncbi:hypothetical protein NPM_3910 [Nostoc sp. 'Peltigera membranacea cyanobiont' N6]|nr:hypothetical protein NPM_3910 [Nostoc sp. 'Peltigera membranacea cyanobiont' N6]
MSLIDGIFLTLLNTVACLALPKFLVIMSAKSQNTATSESNSEIASFS